MKADTERVRGSFSPACLVLFVTLIGLSWISVYNRLLFQVLAELFSIFLIASIFLFTWNTRRFQENHYFLFLGIAYLFIGSVDFVHTLTYTEGIEVFEGITGYSAAVQLWIAARYMESISLLLAFLFLHKKLNEYFLFFSCLSLVVLLFYSVFSQSFPVDFCSVNEERATAFLRNSEYLICSLFLLSFFIFHKKQKEFKRQSLLFLQTAVLLAFLVELTAVFSAPSCSPPLNTTFGVLGRIVSLYCLAKTVFQESLMTPYNILLKKIRGHEEKLEDKVRERTAALQQSTEQLEKEVVERIKAEKELLWELSIKKDLAAVSDALISRAFSPREIAESVLNTAQSLTGCLRGFVSTVDPVTGVLTVYPGDFFFTRERGKKQPVLLLPDGENGEYPGLWGRALNTRQSFYTDFISSCEKEPVFPQGLEPKKNFLNVPALIDGKAVGQIALADKQGGFTRHDLLAVERLAALFALSVQRKKMEDALNRSELDYRELFNDALDMIHILDRQKRIIRVNPVELETLGCREEEVIGRPLVDFIHPIYKERTVKALDRIFSSGKSIKNHETALIGKDGRQIDIEVSAVPRLEQGRVVSVRAIMRNITERKREENERKKLEVQLRHSRKMEAVGTLAGGIAHDFNNILGPIFGYTELALDVLPEDDRISLWLQEVLKASHRARELVRQILTISRKADQDVQPLRIQILIKEALKLLRFSLPSNIEIRQNITPDCGPVLADPTRIHQVIMNLCTNAYHAMRESGGILEVSLKEVFLTGEDVQNRIRLQAGSYLQLTVQDTGSGIPEQLLEKIFEPYFTTKAQGEGTGLGLAVVQSIILDFCGDITVHSEADKGTVFSIYLPVIRSEEEEGGIEEGSLLPRGRGIERILVVDDDQELLLLNRKILETLGYQVTICTESGEALADFQRHPDRYDLVITDMTMPKMTGDELTRRMLALRPELAMIICTGFSELMDEDKAREIGARALLMKPLTKKELACAVRQVLDQGQGL